MKNDTEYEVSLSKRSRNRLILAALVILIVLLLALIVSFKLYASTKEKSEQKIAELEAEIEKLSEPVAIYTEDVTKEIALDVINAEIQNIGELATLEYLYTDAGKFSDPKKLFGKNIPFTTKAFIAKWDGSIKAGVKVDKITTEINEEKKEILVYIPTAEILSHEIDDESIETLSEKDGLFNPVKVEDVREFDAISKDAMEQRAIENGILDKAQENAKEIIYKLIYTDFVKDQGYSIVFEEIGE